MITPNASLTGSPPTEVEAPMAKLRMNVEARGPELTLPLSKERPTKKVRYPEREQHCKAIDRNQEVPDRKTVYDTEHGHQTAPPYSD